MTRAASAGDLMDCTVPHGSSDRKKHAIPGRPA